MDFFICAYGEPSEEQFIPYVKDIVDGFEIQNYDRKGVVSDAGWQQVLAEHRRIRPRLPGRLAVHGPFAGIDYTYKDHLLREAVRRRMDMVFEMVQELQPDTLVLHTGCSDIMVSFNLADQWLEPAVAFWKDEIKRYEACGVLVVLENIAERTPDSMIRLIETVGSDFLGLCFDIGHAGLCSPLSPAEWVEQMGRRLKHVHLHDNNGKADEHLPVGKGKTDFDSFFAALARQAPDATVSMEVIADPQTVIENVLYVTRRYGGK